MLFIRCNRMSARILALVHCILLIETSQALTILPIVNNTSNNSECAPVCIAESTRNDLHEVNNSASINEELLSLNNVSSESFPSLSVPINEEFHMKNESTNRKLPLICAYNVTHIIYFSIPSSCPCLKKPS